MVESRTVGGDEGGRVQLERQAVGLGNVTLSQLDMAQSLVGRLLRAAGEGQVLGELGVRKTHAAFGGDIRPQVADVGADVPGTLARELELASLRLGQLRNPLGQHEGKEGPQRPDGDEENQDDEDPCAPGDSAGRSEYPARGCRSWEGHEEVTLAVSLLLPTDRPSRLTDL